MDPETALAHWTRLSKKSTKDFIKTIQEDIIASDNIQDPVFGKKKSTYVDWIGSNRALRTFESIINETVLPYCASTHSHTTSTSRSTAAAIHHSRAAVAKSLNAQTVKGHQHEAVVIFCGGGAAPAILKLRDTFRLADEAFWTQMSAVDQQRVTASQATPSTTAPLFVESFDRLPSGSRPVVFISAQENDYNIVPWRDSVADVVVIPDTADCVPDLRQLEEQLVLHWERPLKLGSFSAGSGLTGVLNNTVAIAEILHKYDALAFFDYSEVGAYTPIDMNPRPSNSYTMMRDSRAYKDGVFINPNTMLGGLGSSGILAARLEIFSWTERHGPMERSKYIPARPGVGAVDFAMRRIHKYADSVVVREEADTPNTLANIRAGLTFRLQQIMNPRLILAKENWHAAEVFQRLSNPGNNIVILGTPKIERIALFCVTVSVPQLSTPLKQLQIHYSLLGMIMNDFFGVEMGCGRVAAGPYAMELLKVNTIKEKAMWNLLLGNIADEKGRFGDRWGSRTNVGWSSAARDGEPGNDDIHVDKLSLPFMKPGFVRFNFPHFAREKDVDFVLESLEWVAQYGFLLIPLYRLDTMSGTWSVRPVVRHAICRSLNSKRLNSGNRADYIRVATDCIYGLQTLFKLQQKEILDNTSSSPYAPSETAPTGVFHPLNQARRSLRNLFSGSRTHLPSSSASLAMSTTNVPQTIPSPYPHQENFSFIGLHANNSSMSMTYYPPLPTHALMEDASPLGRGGGPSSADLSIEVLSGTDSSPRSFGSSSGTTAVAISPPKWYRQSTSDTITKDALEELSWARLEAELSAIETSALAKQLRWFVSPLEVAELYVSNYSAGPGSLPCFPPRIAKKNGCKG
ncbi:pyridoxal phosphate-dependent transferase [Gamsiella multidivaricata]|uniref:pyridoxal phosphate-dependent transferase n=1 Tax=Gamsiella multidivaricata TaxID=101098 RepID=UPI00221EDEE5|nr:pyridoxal phosphate-dependent transferase [Gamsiella multidivaricata]KAI7816490.1 pyridoxal phosphate-dependent transferase [Gamsiella multidivaricata]